LLAVSDDGFKYWAFISYSHADAKWGDWLHAALETYRVPSRLVRNATPEGSVPRRIFPVFRDREELASSASLGENIENALRLSRALVVICSPRAAASRWVNEEIKLYKSMGREDRVFCLIVDGEPNATAESGLLECFPATLREPAEPIAADARENKDGKGNALLKLIAGIVGVPYDELRQRERQRQVRQRIKFAAILAGAIAAIVLAYLAVADVGVNLPGGEAIRTNVDRHELSLFRRVHSDNAIHAFAARLRGELVNVFRQRLNDGWISAAPLNVNRTSEIWAHSQALFAIFQMPDNPEAQREFLPALEIPFAPALEDNEPHRRYHWIDLDGVEYDKSTPVLWIAAAQGTALGKPGLLEGPQREAVQRHYQYVQEILKDYHPTESGGWNMLPFQKDPNKHHLYSTTLALLTLLQAKKANLPWDGSGERRDQLIRQTAQWLVEHFDSKGDPGSSPGWRGIGEDTLEIYDGLTIQIFAELLETQQSFPDFNIPAVIMDEIPRQLGLFARRDLSFPVNGGEFLAQYTRFDGQEGVGRRLIKYLWYPWVIDCSMRWLQFAEKNQLPKEQRVQVKRAVGHLVVDLGDEALKRAQRDYTFFAAEDLYGLAGIKPPGR
jgi:hypothetical protein